jgi:hypothetical protein
LATFEGALEQQMLNRMVRGIFHGGEMSLNWSWLKERTVKCGDCLNRKG